MTTKIEDGYMKIANEIAQVLMQTNLSAYQSRILWAIWRKTYGWNKKEDWISNSQLVKMTGIRKQHVSRTIKELKDRNIVTKSGYKSAFNKYHSQWRELPKQVTVTESGYKKVTNPGNGVTNPGEHNIHLYNKQKNYCPKSLNLSNLLASLILKNNPSHKGLSDGKYESTVKRWAEDVERMIRLDKRQTDEIERVIRWCQANSFWRGNILSGTKLREKFDQLLIQMKNQTQPQKKEESLGAQYPIL